MKSNEILCRVVPQSQRYANGLERVCLYVPAEFMASLEDMPNAGERLAITFSTPTGNYEGGLRDPEGAYICPDLRSKTDGTKASLASVLKDNKIEPRDLVKVRVSGRSWTLLSRVSA